MTDHEKALEKIDAENKKLADQIAENNKKREGIVAETKNKIIETIKSQVKQYEITAEEIFGALKISKPKKAKKASKEPEVLYRNEKGETWSGARGRLPNWVKAIKNAGDDIEKYRIKD